MKKIICISLVLLIMGISCSESKSEKKDEKKNMDSVTVSTAIVPTPLDSTQLPEAAKAFILPDYEVLKFQKGDLNKDNIDDIVLVLENKKGDKQASRPLLILTQDPKGIYTKAARNDKVVACKGCGGMLGDPLAGISIKNNFFTVEEEGGSRERWSRYISFRFDTWQKTWLLHRIDESSVDTQNAKNDVKSVKTEKNFGKVLFSEYDAEKME